jgi:hypothetical protein
MRPPEFCEVGMPCICPQSSLKYLVVDIYLWEDRVIELSAIFDYTRPWPLGGASGKSDITN